MIMRKARDVKKKNLKSERNISGRVTDRLNWIVYGQSKVYPDAPSYSGTKLNRFVRQEIGRITNNDIETSDDSD
jgi:hypothetical protein